MADLSELRVPAFCPTCRGLMKGKSTNTWYDWKVCVNCFIEFIEDREDRWKSGWRPTSEAIENMKKKNNGEKT